MAFSEITTLTKDEINRTTLLDHVKGGKLLRNNKTIYFQHLSQVELQVYPYDYVDYVKEWGAIDLRLNDLQKNLVFEKERKVPVRCTFKNGESSDYCFVLLTHFPPRLSFFTDGYKPTWYYLNQITAMSPSPRAVGPEVWSAMVSMEKRKREMLEEIFKIEGNLVDNAEYEKLIRNGPRPVVVRNDKGELFKFQCVQQLVYHEDVNPSSFSLINNPTPQQINSARELYISEDPNADRKDARPPSVHVYIIADSESDTTDNFLLAEI